LIAKPIGFRRAGDEEGMRSWLAWLAFSSLFFLLSAACAGKAEDEIILSGRVQLDPESAEPVANAFVRVIDANKSHRCFVTACDGTFEVRRGDVPSLVMPLASIAVERVGRPDALPGETKTLVHGRMRGAVREERSCNACHAGGVSLFRTADAVPRELREAARSCANEPALILCPEDRVVPDGMLPVVRDFDAYEKRVHPAFVRRCGSSDCHGGSTHALQISGDREASFTSVRAHEGTVLMENARGHGGVRAGDVADQCMADWLAVPRAPSSVKLTHADACARAAE
jgi:hypothetical protein